MILYIILEIVEILWIMMWYSQNSEAQINVFESSFPGPIPPFVLCISSCHVIPLRYRFTESWMLLEYNEFWNFPWICGAKLRIITYLPTLRYLPYFGRLTYHKSVTHFLDVSRVKLKWDSCFNIHDLLVNP